MIEAAQSDIAEEVILLAKHGAEIDAREPIGGNTLLMVACYFDCPNTASALLRLGAATGICTLRYVMLRSGDVTHLV